MKNIEESLVYAIKETLLILESEDELVLIKSPERIAERLAGKIKEVYSGDIFTPSELFVLSILASEAASNPNILQGEMEILTGYTTAEMNVFAQRIRSLVNS